MMKKQRNQHGLERLTDSIAYRISATHRSYIEEIAESRNVGLCEAARIVMEAGIEALGKARVGAGT
jgi:hypothetical protein